MTPAAPALTFPLLTPAEVGQMLGGLPVKTVWQYGREGRLPCVRIGRHMRFNGPCVEQAIARAYAQGRTI